MSRRIERVPSGLEGSPRVTQQFAIGRQERLPRPGNLRAVIVATGEGHKLPNLQKLLQLAGWKDIPSGRALPNKTAEEGFHGDFTGVPYVVAALKVLQHREKEHFRTIEVKDGRTGRRLEVNRSHLTDMLIGIFGSKTGVYRQPGGTTIAEPCLPQESGVVIVYASDVMVYSEKNRLRHALHKPEKHKTLRQIYHDLCAELSPHTAEPFDMGVKWGGATLTYPDTPPFSPRGAAGDVVYKLRMEPIPKEEVALFVFGLEGVPSDILDSHTARETYARLVSPGRLSDDDIRLLTVGAGESAYKTNGGWRIEHGLTDLHTLSINDVAKNDPDYPRARAGLVAAVTSAPWQVLGLFSFSARWGGSPHTGYRGKLFGEINRAAKKALGFTNTYPWIPWYPPQEVYGQS